MGPGAEYHLLLGVDSEEAEELSSDLWMLLEEAAKEVKNQLIERE